MVGSRFSVEREIISAVLVKDDPNFTWQIFQHRIEISLDNVMTTSSACGDLCLYRMSTKNTAVNLMVNGYLTVRWTVRHWLPFTLRSVL